MSFGLMSAIRLTPLSWLVAFDVFRFALVRALVPGWIASLLTMTPSMTYSGSDEPNTEVTPRRRTWLPPPGAPEFAMTCAPAIRPDSALSTDGDGTLAIWSAVTCATSFAAFCRAMLVAAPVMTCASSCRTSRTSATVTSVCVASTGTVRRL